MLCEAPFIKEGLALPCGRCLSCKSRNAKVWAHRIMLEAACHESNVFVTLTYSDQVLEKTRRVVRLREVQLFNKRLRKSGYAYRFYAVGEYGELSLRPHYHLALFGFPQCYRGQTDMRKHVCCKTCEAISAAWQKKGAIQVAFLEPASAAYIAGYVTKKLTKKPLAPELLPEFHTMSRRPGLGLDVMDDVANVLLGYDLEKELEDVPQSLAHGKFKLPLGRYLRGQLRRRIGRDERCPPSVLEKAKEELRPLRESAFNSSSSFAEKIVEKNTGKIRSLHSKLKIRQSKRTAI